MKFRLINTRKVTSGWLWHSGKQVGHLQSPSCPKFQFSQFHPQPCSRPLAGLVLPPCLCSLGTPANLAGDPDFLLSITLSAPPSSPSPLLWVIPQYLNTLLARDARMTTLSVPHYHLCCHPQHSNTLLTGAPPPSSMP